MRQPSPHAAPNVLLLLSGALGMWAVVIALAVSAWPRQQAAPKAVHSNTPSVSDEAQPIQVRAPASMQFRSLKRTKVSKAKRKRRKGPSLASRIFATSAMH
jgi:cytoskeletal protein RodZ